MEGEGHIIKNEYLVLEHMNKTSLNYQPYYRRSLYNIAIQLYFKVIFNM